MKRRLLIGKALVHRPRVIFLDEPTAGVDVALRRELWQYVRVLRERGTTIVLTTHYLEEAEALADRVAVIDQGRLITVDTPRGLLRRHGKRRLRVTFSQPLSAGLQLPEALARAGAEVDQGAHDPDLPAGRGRAGAAAGGGVDRVRRRCWTSRPSSRAWSRCSWS